MALEKKWTWTSQLPAPAWGPRSSWAALPAVAATSEAHAAAAESVASSQQVEWGPAALASARTPQIRERRGGVRLQLVTLAGGGGSLEGWADEPFLRVGSWLAQKAG